MKLYGAIPRTLADDVFYINTGQNAVEKAIDNMRRSRQFFEDMGSKNC